MKLAVDSMQVFFPASLEIQEELLKAGFKVPYDKESKARTPVPVVSSFSGGRVIRKERVLKAGKFENDGRYCILPEEKAWVEMLVNEKGFVMFKILPGEYHLEDLGFTSVPPRLWSTWAAFSLKFESIESITEALQGHASEKPKGIYLASRGTGREIEVYGYKGRKSKNLGIPVFRYSLGMKGLTLAEEYFREKAEENGVNPEVLRYLKLGLRKRKETRAGLKVGIVWKEGRPVRVNLRLSTTAPKIRITGIYGELTGKSRGELSSSSEWYFTVHANDLYWALMEVSSAFGSR
ncbi:hypothetical protein JCM16138_22420 [Thermococcus atlanticus]